MGADWYTFKTISAVGFLLKKKQWKKIRATLDEPFDFRIVCTDCEKRVLKWFVFDKRTLTLDSTVDVVGPYEIEFRYNSTCVAKNKHMDTIFKKSIEQMKARFSIAKSIHFTTICSSTHIVRLEKAEEIAEYYRLDE